MATASRGARAIMAAHKQLWSAFWASSSVDITLNATAGSGDGSGDGDGVGADLALLEANYYGSQSVTHPLLSFWEGTRLFGRACPQHFPTFCVECSFIFGSPGLFRVGMPRYLLQSAGRSVGSGHSRHYPSVLGASSLFGPFSTGDYIGWNGDVTLNYNAESPFYGVASSNHLELLLPWVAASRILLRRGTSGGGGGGGGAVVVVAAVALVAVAVVLVVGMTVRDESYRRFLLPASSCAW